YVPRSYPHTRPLRSGQCLDDAYLLCVYGVLPLSPGREWVRAGQCTVLEYPRAHDLFRRYVGFFVSCHVPPVACEPSCGAMMKGYPIFLTGLDTKRCVVIGGGHEAERKVAGLLECAASVTVISPDLTPALHLWVGAGPIAWLAPPYQPGDLQVAPLFKATDGPHSMRAT